MATEQNSTHTPAPWHSSVNGFGTVKVEALGFNTYDGSVVLATMRSSDYIPFEVEKANAAFIVKAVNCHDDLLAALAPFAAVAEHDIGQDEADADLFQVMNEKNARAPRLTVGHLRAALAAIAKAEGRL